MNVRTVLRGLNVSQSYKHDVVGRTDWRAIFRAPCTFIRHGGGGSPGPLVSGQPTGQYHRLALLPRDSEMKMEIGGMGAARESDITAKAIVRLKKRIRGVFSLVRMLWVGLRTVTETETNLVVCEGRRSLLCRFYIYVCVCTMIELALEPRSQMSKNGSRG